MEPSLGVYSLYIQLLSVLATLGSLDFEKYST